MKVDVVCEICSAELPSNTSAVYMQLRGPLYFNPDTKSQAQEYECSACMHRVSIIITVADDTRLVTVRRDK